MGFTFIIKKVERLPRAGVGVLDGTVVTGTVTSGQELMLVHGDQRLPLRLEGVVMEKTRKRHHSGDLSLSFKLKSPAFKFVQAGDQLVAA